MAILIGNTVKRWKQENQPNRWSKMQKYKG